MTNDIFILFCFIAQNTGHGGPAREQLLLQTQKLASRRSEKPPKLPPRDNIYPHDIPKVSSFVRLSFDLFL